MVLPKAEAAKHLFGPVFTLNRPPFSFKGRLALPSVYA